MQNDERNDKNKERNTLLTYATISKERWRATFAYWLVNIACMAQISIFSLTSLEDAYRFICPRIHSSFSTRKKACKIGSEQRTDFSIDNFQLCVSWTIHLFAVISTLLSKKKKRERKKYKCSSLRPRESPCTTTGMRQELTFEKNRPCKRERRQRRAWFAKATLLDSETRWNDSKRSIDAITSSNQVISARPSTGIYIQIGDVQSGWYRADLDRQLGGWKGGGGSPDRVDERPVSGNGHNLFNDWY